MGDSLRLQEISAALDWHYDAVTRVRAWSKNTIELADGSTHYLFAFAGSSSLAAGATFPLGPGMFAAVPGRCVVSSPDGAGIAVTHHGYQGVFQLGGPVEARGRLRYIDGCTDTLLLGPPVLGDPCLNHLHIPAGTRQQRHVHPSVRVGLVLRGEGVCVTPERELALRPGLAFLIGADLLHSFCTGASSLDVLVYHPDSDTGPTDEDHPMLNRTLIRAS